MVSCLQAAPAQTADPVEDAKKAVPPRVLLLRCFACFLACCGPRAEMPKPGCVRAVAGSWKFANCRLWPVLAGAGRAAAEDNSGERGGSGQKPKTDVFGTHAGKSTKHPCARQDLAAARRARELALNENERAENSVKELDKVVAALRRQWLQEFQADNSEKATEAETKLEKAKQELKEAKQELKEAKQELENAETKLEKAKQECKAQAGAQACRGFCVALEKCQP